jgi:hypothetical protein
VARHIFQACPVWIYTQSNITQASYSPEYITPTQKKSHFVIISIIVVCINGKFTVTTFKSRIPRCLNCLESLTRADGTPKMADFSLREKR